MSFCVSIEGGLNRGRGNGGGGGGVNKSLHLKRCGLLERGFNKEIMVWLLQFSHDYETLVTWRCFKDKIVG